MTENEVYDKYLADEEYDLDNATAYAYSYFAGWNEALKRASTLLANHIRPTAYWKEEVVSGRTGDGRTFDYTVTVCSNCMTHMTGNHPNFCDYCGADMRVKDELKTNRG